MKKIYFLLICSILLSSCSLTAEQLFLIPVDTYTPTPTATNTFTPQPTFTPVTPTLTYTTTPTLAGLKTATSIPETTPTLVVSVTPLSMITPSTYTPTVQMEGFVSILVSSTQFYKGTKCYPSSVKFTVQVANPVEVAYVALFVRFKAKTTGSVSDWTSIPMQTIGAGTFIHELISDEMKGDALYRSPWVEYQLVAVNDKAREIGRTEIFKENITMLECLPTPTPLATGVKP